MVVILAAIIRAQTREKEREKESGGRDRGRGMTVSRDKMVVYGSDQTHAIIQKACMILGIPNYRQIPTSAEDNFAMRGESLRAVIAHDVHSLGLLPIVVVATTGTTSSCAFDSLLEVAAVAKDFALWLHVDAAYGGAYACLPELSSLFRGLDFVDSFVVNCHKKLLCPFDLAAMFVADRRPVLQALSLQPEYLRNAASDSGAVVDYEHWQLPLGRRFRALKLWFVFRRFGSDGVRRHVRQGVLLRQHLETLVAKNDLFEVVAPPSLSLLCLRVRGASEEDHHQLLANIKGTGECFIIHTKLPDIGMVLRVACGGIEQSEEDVNKAWAVIAREATLLMSQKS